MIRLLQWLFIGHIHKWNTIEDRPLATKDQAGKVVAKGHRYFQQCEHCGVVVKRDLI